MPRCKNVPEDESPVYYSGNENTPRGRGWCARHEPEGKVRVGTDGKKYCVKGNRWVVKKSPSKKSPSKKSPSKKSPSKRKTSPRMNRKKWKINLIIKIKELTKQKEIKSEEIDRKALFTLTNDELKELINMLEQVKPGQMKLKKLIKLVKEHYRPDGNFNNLSTT